MFVYFIQKPSEFIYIRYKHFGFKLFLCRSCGNYYNILYNFHIYFIDLRFCNCWSSFAKDSTEIEEVESPFDDAVDLELERFGYLTGFVLPENFKTKRNSSISSVLKGTC